MGIVFCYIFIGSAFLSSFYNILYVVFKIFISYSQEDFRAHARIIHNYLSKVIPNSSVFIDQLKPKGEHWREKNDAELVKSDLMVLLVTPAALQSHEVAREVKLATENNVRILTCKHDDLEMPWIELPWNLGAVDGMEFEDDEILKIRLFREIKKIIKITKPVETKISKPKYPPQFVGLVNIRLQQKAFKIKYGHEKGSLEIQSGTVDREACSIDFQTRTSSLTELSITLPRELIDAKVGYQDSEFFILVDGDEVEYEEIAGPSFRTLKFSCSEKTERIEIIGNQILGILYGVGDGEEYTVIISEGASNPDTGNSYDYPHLEINRGDSVTWENHDISAHTITSGTPEGAPDGIFDSSMFLSGSSFSVTFERKGVFPYFDMVNPWMIGTIEVVE